MTTHYLSARTLGAAFAEVLADVPPAQLPAAVAACARLLQRQRLLHQAPRVLDALDETLLAKQSLQRARVMSATSLPATATAQVERALTTIVGQPVQARVSVQPALLAGFRAEVGDLLVDASLRGVLSRMRARVRSRAHPRSKRESDRHG